MLNFVLLEWERKVYRGSKFYTKLDIKIDTEGIIVTHCGLDLLEVLNNKVPFAHVMGLKLFVVCLMFEVDFHICNKWWKWEHVFYIVLTV